MKYLHIAILALLIILCVASGISKTMLLPQELEFFQGSGFSSTLIVVYGVSQLIGAVLLMIPQTRVPGAVYMALNFLVSTVLIFRNGDIPFGLFSLLPVVVSLLVAYQTAKNRKPVASIGD